MGNLYTKLKVFHWQPKLDSLPESVDKILPPIHVRIKPTNVCNHRCWYCAYLAQNLQLGKDMVIKDTIPQTKMMEIIEDLSEMGIRAVSFSGGGEPLCYPYLIPALEALIKHKISFATLTNGSLLTGEAARLFAFYGTWVRVSMDGWDDASYMKYRRVKDGEFTKIISNMKAFKALNGKCRLGMNFVLDKDNYAHFYDVVKQLKDIGVDSVKVSPCIVSNTSEGNNEYHEPFFEAAKDTIEKVCRELVDKNFEVYHAYHRQEISFNKRYVWCPYIQILPIIGADLNVYSCHDKAYNLECGLIGSIKDVRFKDFWLKDKGKFFKINPAKHCSHHCAVNANNEIIWEYLNADPEHLMFV